MSAGLRAFLEGILDYAGMFPPARLPLEQAIHNHARYRREPEAWLLRNFICPTTRLAELAPFAELLHDGPRPWTLSALGRGGSSPDEFLSSLRTDLAAVAEFNAKHQAAAINVFEVRLPAELPPGSLEDAVRLLDEQRPRALGVHFEPAEGDRRSTVSALAERLDRINTHRTAASRAALPRVGLKLRCGGADAAAIPTCEEVAVAVAACRDAAVPLKFTAGLHHPLRRLDPALGTHTHGFVNVFAAGVLAQALRLPEADVRAVLECEDAAEFAFDASGLRWRGRHVPAAAVTMARQCGVTSFGSCSFDEPRDGLRALGLI